MHLQHTHVLLGTLPLLRFHPHYKSIFLFNTVYFVIICLKGIKVDAIRALNLNNGNCQKILGSMGCGTSKIRSIMLVKETLDGSFRRTGLLLICGRVLVLRLLI